MLLHFEYFVEFFAELLVLVRAHMHGKSFAPLRRGCAAPVRCVGRCAFVLEQLLTVQRQCEVDERLSCAGVRRIF